MANSLLTPTIITRKALMILHQKLTFIGSINRQYDEQYARTGAKIGQNLTIRMPNKYTVRTGRAISVQDQNEQSQVLTLATQKGVDMNFTSSELTLTIDDFAERYIEPAMAVLAANIEADAFNMYKDVYNVVGLPGTDPNSLTIPLQARAKLNQFLTPAGSDRNVVLNSNGMLAIVDALKALFHDSKELAAQYRDGMMGHAAGFKWWENDIVPTHTNGSMGGTPLTNAVVAQTGSSLITDGWTAGNTITQGTVFTIAGVFAVHPETKVAYPFLQQFVVTADVTVDGSGNATLPISPSITTSGALQTVSAGAANNKALTISTGSASTGYANNMAYHKDAFTFVTADLELPGGVDFAKRETYDGLSMRIVRAYDINNDQMPCRLDILYAYKTIRPEMACRIVGA